MYFKATIVLVLSTLLSCAHVPPMAYPLNATVQPSLVILAQVPVMPMNNIVYPINGDIDGDGVLNSIDAFPSNPNEWLDTDHDGIGNNTDDDDDDDGLLDSIELIHGLNPLSFSDAQADYDGDGFSNSLEVSLGTNIRDYTSKPKWIPVLVEDIMIVIPSR